ncbi:hypothetical protein [Streptomyces beijiangensis]|uniref:Uncharacterized protein n=1 Tax=Streptomyces beijiangensis TaxID=163361 RepID=A0A939FDP5_9ACTN|nr:hypothetical protein [Streptomyces beijiangensis]MBO0515145.1 hypothetical protein [Streptomyces beijiangensis]
MTHEAWSADSVSSMAAAIGTVTPQWKSALKEGVPGPPRQLPGRIQVMEAVPRTGTGTGTGKSDKKSLCSRFGA